MMPKATITKLLAKSEMVDNYLTRNYLFDNTTSDRSRVSYSLLQWYVTSFVAIETVLPKESIFHEPSWKLTKTIYWKSGRNTSRRWTCSCFGKLYLVSFDHFTCKSFYLCEIFIRPTNCLWYSHILTELLDDER